MKKTLCKATEIYVPDELGLDSDNEMEYAENKAREMYKNKEIVFTENDDTGMSCIMVKHENGTETSWTDM